MIENLDELRNSVREVLEDYRATDLYHRDGTDMEHHFRVLFEFARIPYPFRASTECEPTLPAPSTSEGD